LICAINRYVGNLPPMRACFRTTRRRLYFGQRTIRAAALVMFMSPAASRSVSWATVRRWS